MKFKIFMFDNGYFNEAQVATALGLKRTQSGDGWLGWVSLDELKMLDRTDYNFKVVY